MFFNALTLMRFSPAVADDLERMEAVFAEHRLRPCGPVEQGTRGFVPPIGRPGDELSSGDETLTHRVNGASLFIFGREEKLLPGSVVNDALTKRVRKIADEEGRKVGHRERKRLKQEVQADLLSRAFVRESRVGAYVEPQNGWLAMNTSSRKTAEALVSQVREALGSFPAVPLAPEEGPRVLMTEWLANGTLPAGLSLGDECELREPSAQGAISRSRRQDLSSDDIAEHLRQGKQVFQLGLVFEDRLSFVLSEDLSIRKLKFLDVVVDQLGTDHADAASEADATFALMTLELGRLFAGLEQWFVLPRPSDS